ncbi:carboxymuconolactone decarboxylase family protein [Compostibacter hankyongensis]|uniref:Carboxymuconolactone decarboxylase family protein n=1 Tax=Compostibacter hankyongensis TaxID=1007089 RepID=A0ABP8FBV6_9BACT
MKKRFSFKTIEPEGFKAMRGMEQYLSATGIDPLHKELIKVRASQLNGCAFCLDMHARKARELGETEQRLYLLNAWREAPQFSEEEKLILAMTEEITLIGQQGLSEATYEQAVEHFGEKGTAQLMMVIVVINSWNRIMVATQEPPGGR